MKSRVEQIIGKDGAFAQCFDGYEYRPQQIEMASSIVEAIEEGRHCLVEAGTGVGKTVAYLTPAIIQCVKGKPVVISTHTINLQEQLIKKDIPLMKRAMPDIPFKAMLVKGRSNYLCLWELEQARADITMVGDPLFEKVLDWAEKTNKGDVAELDFAFPNWGDICSNQDTCRGRRCEFFEKCHYYGMRRRAASSDVIVVNHSLFFSDLGVRMSDPTAAILPEYGMVVFDEAHHLEDVASKVFGIEFTNYRVQSLLNRIKKKHEIAVTQTELDMVGSANKELFTMFQDIPRSEFFLTEALSDKQRQLAEMTATELMSLLEGLNSQLSEQDTNGDEDLQIRIDGWRRSLGRMSEELKGIFFNEHENYFKWCEKPASGKFVNCSLRVTPVDVAQALAESLWSRRDSIILTSATLSNSGGFSYIGSRLGTPDDAIQVVLGSLFNYKEQALLYVPRDLDFPSEKWVYAEAVAERIEELINLSEGRAFLLFTSYRMLNSVYDLLKDNTPFKLLKQGEKSNDLLLKDFRKSKNACLMGVHSFWEGVDVRGEKLSCVIIDKLPFAAPDSPINKARCDAIVESGGDWFLQYAVPQAQIRLKQGFGRLIRTKSDSGVVAILDSRILKKSYGREFLRYLPSCKGTANLEEVEEFFNSKRLAEPEPSSAKKQRTTED